MLFRGKTFIAIALSSCTVVVAQQVPDTLFSYRAPSPAYAHGAGPTVVLDEAHANFHTLGGRYRAFGRVIADDGYVLRPGTQRFDPEYLSTMRILVIANALGPDDDWVLPTAPAFSREEARAVEQWVENGGSLLLIADHMPFGGAAARLGRAFGFNWIDGYALPDDGAQEIFSRGNGSLTENPITNGSGPQERIDSIALFTGSAFMAPPTAVPITRLVKDYSILLPQRAGAFTDSTAWIDGRYFINGALLEHGRGRVVAFGEAAMFSAQRQGPDRTPVGMNQPAAVQNAQFLLNVIHWLDRRF